MKKNSLLCIVSSLLLLALLSGCTLITPPAAGESSAPASITQPSSASPADDAAVATVTTRSLRVRSQPLETAEVVAGVSEGEQYLVLGISSDGQWVQLAIDDAPGGAGWVAASFVSLEGPITDTATVAVPAAPVTTTETITSETVTSEQTVTVEPPPAGFALIVTDGTRLRVRGEPNAESEIVGYVYNGETYAVEEVSSDGEWVRIAGSPDAVTDNPDGGWVAAQFLVIGE